jgi:hypothetical protein
VWSIFLICRNKNKDNLKVEKELQRVLEVYWGRTERGGRARNGTRKYTRMLCTYMEI